MLGDLIYEAKGKVVGQRILAVAPQTKIENTILLDGVMRGIVNIIDTGTFVSTAIDDTVYYSQGQGVITTKDGKEMAVWTAQGIQQHNIRDETIITAYSVVLHFTIQRQMESLLFLIIL